MIKAIKAAWKAWRLNRTLKRLGLKRIYFAGIPLDDPGRDYEIQEYTEEEWETLEDFLP